MIVVLDNIRSAHNVGSIIRTCDALGVPEVHLCGITPGPEDKGVEKTALGAEAAIQVYEKEDTYSDLTDLREKGYQIVGLELDKRAMDIAEFQPAGRFALVVGNEVSGLSEDTLKLCDVIVRIPMKGIKESLNVSVAFGIAAYELTNKRPS